MNLNGWDTIYVARTDPLNAALRAHTQSLVQSLSFEQNGFSASGTLGGWSMVPGGSQSLLLLQVEILVGTMTMAAGGQPIDVGGAGVQLLVNLRLLPPPAGSSDQQLVFDLGSVGATPGPGVVTPHDVVGLPSLNQVQKAALADAVAQDLVAHAGEVSFVLATVNPLSATGVPWLTPVRSSYAYVAPVGSPPALAILSVVSDRDISELPLTVDPGVLQGPGNCGLAIDPALVLAHVVGPALLTGMQASGRLSVDGSGVLRNSNPLSLPAVNHAGETYSPRVDSLAVNVTDSLLNVSIDGSCDLHMGVEMTFGSASSLTLSLSSDLASLELGVVGTPTFHKAVQIPWYDHLFDICGGLAEFILQVCVAAISSEVAGNIATGTSAQELVKSAPTIVSWADADGFSVESATLATALCLRGTLP